MVGSWLPTQVSQSIEYKESFVVAAYISGPKWSSKKSTSYRRVAQWQKSCGQALQEPLPSCHWFAISVSWRLVTLFLSLPFQLGKSQTLFPTHCFSHQWTGDTMIENLWVFNKTRLIYLQHMSHTIPVNNRFMIKPKQNRFLRDKASHPERARSGTILLARVANQN